MSVAQAKTLDALPLGLVKLKVAKAVVGVATAAEVVCTVAALAYSQVLGSIPLGALYHLGAHPSLPLPLAQQFFFMWPGLQQLSHTG